MGIEFWTKPGGHRAADDHGWARPPGGYREVTGQVASGHGLTW
jgi:hypothetical protein